MISIAVLVWAAIFASTSCNRMIFVDRFMPSVPEEIVLDGEHQEYVVNFLAGNWDIATCYADGAFQFTCQATDLEGNSVSSDYALLQGTGIVDMEIDGLCNCRLVRRDMRTLEIIADNAGRSEVGLTIVLGNEDDIQSLKLRVLTSSRYVIEDIDFELTGTSRTRSRYEFGYTNSLDHESSITVNPMQFGCSFVSMDLEDYLELEILEDGVKISVPLSCEDGEYVMSDPEVGLIPGTYGLSCSYTDETEQELLLPANSQCVLAAYVTYDVLDLAFTIHARNPDDGRTREIHGTMSSNVAVSASVRLEDVSPIDAGN